MLDIYRGLGYSKSMFGSLTRHIETEWAYPAIKLTSIGLQPLPRKITFGQWVRKAWVLYPRISGDTLRAEALLLSSGYEKPL